MTAPLLQACLNGSRAPSDHPRLPVEADELAAEAGRAWLAGAQGVHVHARGPRGEPTLAPGACAETVAAIRIAAPHVEISLGTEGVDAAASERIASVHAWTVLPDTASVSFAEEGAEDLCLALHHRGVEVEAGVTGLADARRLLVSGMSGRCRRIVVGVADPDPADAVAHAARIDAVLGESLLLPRLHHGRERATWAVLVAASRQGRDVRVGLEDSLVLPDGRPSPGNEAMVRAVSELQRRAARPA